MKKYLIILTSLLTAVIMLAACIPYRAVSEDHTKVKQSVPEPIMQSTPESVVQLTPEPTDQTTIEPVEEALTASEAQASLYERFGVNVSIVYTPEMDKQEDGVQLFCFSVDYSDMHEVIAFGSLVKVWVNSDNGVDSFEEPYLYANIPDYMFPIPMRDGSIVEYNRFTPPNQWDVTTSYSYTDMSVMELYKAQLAESGFEDLGSENWIDSIWRYFRSEDEVLLVAEMYCEDRFTLVLYVNPWRLGG